MEKKDIEFGKLGGKTTKDKIENALYCDDNIENIPKIIDIEHYIEYQSQVLFKILDKIIKNSRQKLHSKNKNIYEFNDDNIMFFNTLLDLYEMKDKNCINLCAKKYDELDDEFIELLHNGWTDLAKNDATMLQLDEVEREWNLLFNPEYKKICDLVEDLRADVIYYVGAICPKDENEELYEMIKSILRKTREFIVEITEDKLEFPEIDINEVAESGRQFQEAKKLKSERAKKGWEKRRKNQ